MAYKFSRNTTDHKYTTKKEIPLSITNENDFVSFRDGKTHFIRRKTDYHCLTDNVKSIKINSTEFLADENNHVTTQKLTEKVDKYSPNENGFISTDYPLSVNGQTIDNKTNRNIEIDTGVITVNGQAPDETGNVELETGVLTVNGQAPDETGNVELKTSGSNDKIFINGMKLKTGNFVTGNNNFDIPLNVVTSVIVEKEVVSNGMQLTFSGDLILDFTNTPVSLVKKGDILDGRFKYSISYKEGTFSSYGIGLSDIPINQNSFSESGDYLYISFNDLPPLIITDSIYKENVPMIIHVYDTSINEWDKNRFIPFQFNCDVYASTNEPS